MWLYCSQAIKFLSLPPKIKSRKTLAWTDIFPMKQNISSNKALILFILIILDMFGEVTIAAGLVLFAHHVYSVIGDRFITHSGRIVGCGAGSSHSPVPITVHPVYLFLEWEGAEQPLHHPAGHDKAGQFGQPQRLPLPRHPANTPVVPIFSPAASSSTKTLNGSTNKCSRSTSPKFLHFFPRIKLQLLC